jgi:hypothetical protein
MAIRHPNQGLLYWGAKMAKQVATKTDKLRFKPSSFAKRVRAATFATEMQADFALDFFFSNPAGEAYVKSERAKGKTDQEIVIVATMAAAFKRPQPSEDGLLIDVFKYCELDPNNPLHWRALFDAMIDAGFRNAGAKARWTEEEYLDLMLDIRALQIKWPSVRTHGETARQLQKRHPYKAKYENFDWGYLRKLVAKAQNPKINFYASLKPGDSVSELYAVHSTKKAGLSVEIDEAYRQRVTDFLSKNSGMASRLEEDERLQNEAIILAGLKP